MSARDDILGRVRARLGRNSVNAATGREALARRIAEPPPGPRPAPPNGGRERLERFVERSLALASSVDRVATSAAAPAATARYLATLGVAPAIVLAPALADLDWAGAGLRVRPGAARGDDLVGVTGVFCAVAETGTLVLCSAAGSPATVSLLPETHIALVPASRIVAGMEEAWALIRAELGSLPRAVNFVSGPSRTADIEQTIVLGAHGPYRVHVVVIEDLENPGPASRSA